MIPRLLRIVDLDSGLETWRGSIASFVFANAGSDEVARLGARVYATGRPEEFGGGASPWIRVEVAPVGPRECDGGCGRDRSDASPTCPECLRLAFGAFA